SRRRHTRFSRDWSSDVCSSDLRTLRGLKLARKTENDVGLFRQVGVAVGENAPGVVRDLALVDFVVEGAVYVGALAGQVYHSASVDRKSTRLNSSHVKISYAVFC